MGLQVKLPSTTKKANRHALLMQSAAKKLEQHQTLFVLNVAEYRAARAVVYAAVDFVNEYISLHPRSKKLPRVFNFCGARYWIDYSTWGRVKVRLTGSKARFPSVAFVI